MTRPLAPRGASADDGRMPRALIVLLAAALLAPGAASAATVPADALGIVGDEHVLLPPYASPDRAAPSATVANVGDVDADGRDDTAIVLDSFEPAYPPSVWVTFSSSQLPSTVAAGQPGWRGFRIVGDHFSPSVTGLGDVNGDGLGEVVVHGYGDTRVVFGRTDGATVDVSSLGANGFSIAGVEEGAFRGFGSTCCGTAYQNTTMTSAGDQNGDGLPDLAFRDGRSVKVAYTPASPAGKIVHADALGDGGFTLDTGASVLPDPFVGRLGDLDGDGREDLGVMWADEDHRAAYAVGVVSPGPGAVVDLRAVADAGTGFELVARESRLENGIATGDQNGDGRRDLGLVTFGFELGSRERSLTIGFTPPLGTRRTILPLSPGEGLEVGVYNGNVIDVGDQDGDGRSDLAFSNVVWHSADGRIEAAGRIAVPDGLGGAIFLGGRGLIVVGSLADRNGDGRRELVVVHADPYDDEPPDYLATWMLDVFVSAPPPVPVEIEPPALVDGALQFAGTFATSPGGPSRTLGARSGVVISDERGATRTVLAPDVVDAGGGSTRARVSVGAAGIVRGARYTYRLLMENGRGLVGASAPRAFALGADGVVTPLPGPGTAAPRAVWRIRTGTRGRDRLVGTRRRDWLRGLGGADYLRGAPNRDRLDGGSGNDTINARDGEVDTVRCGPGRDRVVADRRDRLSRCERVRRLR
jgi:hypothetical protein